MGPAMTSKTQNSRRVKVAHIITRLELGGAQQNTLYCCSRHDSQKYEVILICGTGGTLEGEARKSSNPYKTFFLPELKHPLRPWWDAAALLKITRLLKEEKVQIVHTHSSKAGILGRWAAKLAGVPYVVHTVHGWGFFPGQFFPIRWVYQILEKLTAPFTSKIIAVSADNENEGLSLGIGKKEQYRVIHSGIEMEYYSNSPPGESKAKEDLEVHQRPCVLVLSNFKNQKAPLDVVRAAEALKPKCPEVLFLWAGDGPLRVKVEDSIREKNLSVNFNLMGWREDTPRLLAACDVLLLTSLHEGLPRVVLQAMAAGKPVVATAVNGTPEAVKNGVTGFLHAPHETDGFAESLHKLLSDKALAEKMGKAGKRRLQGTFLIGNMLEEIEKLYDELLQGKK